MGGMKKNRRSMNLLVCNSNVCPRRCKYEVIHHGYLILALLKAVGVPKADEFRKAFTSTVVC